jgi:hypothetical protein
MILFAWSGGPFAFAGAQQLWISTSGSNYGYWVNAQSDQLVNRAASETNPKKAIDELNQADQFMTNDAYVLPISGRRRSWRRTRTSRTSVTTRPRRVRRTTPRSGYPGLLIPAPERDSTDADRECACGSNEDGVRKSWSGNGSR